MRTIFPFLKPYRVWAVVALILMLTELIVELIAPLYMARIINEGVLKKDLDVVFHWGIVMILLSLLAFGAGITNSFFAAKVSQGFGFDVRRKVFEKVQSFAFSDFNQFPTSSLITRMTSDVSQVQNTVFMSLRIMLRAPLLIIGSLVMAVIVSPKLSIIFLLSTPFVVYFLIWVFQKGGGIFRAVQEKLDGVNSVLRETLAAMRLVKVFTRKTYEISRFSLASEELMKRSVLALKLIESSVPLLLLIMNVSIVIVLWFGAIDIRNGDATVGDLVAIVNYTTRMTAAFSIFAFIVTGFARARASSRRITEVLSVVTESEEEDDSEQKLKGDLVFKDVSFTYPDAEYPALHKISFAVRAGKSIAIMGATGSGKSTLAQLIPKLFEHQTGLIEVDDISISNYHSTKLRRQIGYVAQEPLLFTGTIRENILWGKEDATDEEIIRAAIDAQIHETILTLPEGYETRIGQRGVNLSGGQKQRISIARALIRKPKILILDDSTSALDMKTEAELLLAIKQYECTLVLITQKVSTASGCNDILLLMDGEIEAHGSYEELLKTSSLFKRIVESQVSREKMLYVENA